MKKGFKYVIIGGGLAGASAIKGIRGRDKEGGVLLIGAESERPYDRPPLTKKLWFGKKKVDEIFLDEPGYYGENGVELRLGKKAVKLDPAGKTVTDETGAEFSYEKLLIATGGVPRKLDLPGADIDDIIYYRNLGDYTRLRERAGNGASAIVVGGGFIGSEIAASLNMNGVDVTMVFPSPYLCHKVFPEGLGRAVQAEFGKRGIKVFASESPASFAGAGGKLVARTTGEMVFQADVVIVGAGILPAADLARGAGLKVEDGITVDEFMRTSVPDVYAAGDVANFPYKELGKRMRVEHWDNALSQGTLAGANMAGGAEPYYHMPYFFSDLFDFGYEAVGEVNSSLETFADWQEENMKGVVYYLREGRVRGVMLCNIWDKVDEARDLIKKGERFTHSDLKGKIK
ncbi:MAG: FAD-dependent oxidoreductase [Thermodesulfobacteriota bacterium]|nr:MAG: FAD-dependent oxidoreductase [Thermodesulfobacteriota bacterium]